MTDYRKALKAQLKCIGPVRDRLLDRFDQMLDAYREENGRPSYTNLAEAFGPPETMAQALMEGVSPQEQAAFRRTQNRHRLLYALALSLLVGYALWVTFLKDYSLHATDRIETSPQVQQHTLVSYEKDIHQFDGNMITVSLCVMLDRDGNLVQYSTGISGWDQGLWSLGNYRITTDDHALTLKTRITQWGFKNVPIEMTLQWDGNGNYSIR